MVVGGVWDAAGVEGMVEHNNGRLVATLGAGKSVVEGAVVERGGGEEELELGGVLGGGVANGKYGVAR